MPKFVIELEVTCDHDQETVTSLVREALSDMQITHIDATQRPDFTMGDVKTVESLYLTPVTWNLADVLTNINDQSEDIKYSRRDIKKVSVKWNRLNIFMTDGSEWEDEGGYDGEIDWKYPHETVFLDENCNVLSRE